MDPSVTLEGVLLQPIDEGSSSNLPEAKHDPVLASHPRGESLRVRELLVEGVRIGITSQQGLIAHGRGEAYDYLIGERTRSFAETAIKASVAALMLAERPVISVNGNAAALVPGELVRLSRIIEAPLEINIFHHSEARIEAIVNHLEKFGSGDVLKPSSDTVIEGLRSGRRFINPDGIAVADVVFVPLEDGDRCGALRAAGKSVITVDLNPLSRTSRDASITIVDNVVRALPLMVDLAARMTEEYDRSALHRHLDAYHHSTVLRLAERAIRSAN